MLDILKFIFSSFWIFIGTVILIYDAGIVLALIISALRKAPINASLFGSIHLNEKNERTDKNF